MLSLLFKQDKSLVNTTPNVRIYQKESYADALQVLVPTYYGDTSLEDYSLILEYVDPTNIAHSEPMIRDEELYKDQCYRYLLPLDSKFTNAAGKVVLKIDLIRYDAETERKYVIHSGTISVQISAWDDYFQFTPAETIATIDQKMLELQNEAEKLKELSDNIEQNTPTDLTLTDDILQLSRLNEETGENQLIGSGVELLVPSNYDQEDDDHDGVIDLDEDIDHTSSDIDTKDLMFIELSE